MTVLEERGLFWWHHESVPDTQFAPDTCVSGLLKIEDNGVTTLALDGCLTSDEGPMSVLLRADGELQGKQIEGILNISHKHILLSGLAKHGGRFSTSNISLDGYNAIHCLLCSSRFPRISDDVLFSALEIDLAGFEDWLRLGSIETVSTDSTISVEYRRKDPVIYEIDEGKITVEYDIIAPYVGKHRDYKLTLTEKASLIYSPKVLLSLEDMRRQFSVRPGMN